ncbi:hypothetical protein Bca52824_053128 [Brassica carinata]|nr:hypothetical protein Bca52824_053128 [Brassica carinata]
MAKIRWTRKKRTKQLKDITSLVKEVPEVEVEIPKSIEKENEEEAKSAENEAKENEDEVKENEVNEDEVNSDADEENENEVNFVDNEENEQEMSPVDNEVVEKEEHENIDSENNPPVEDVQTNEEGEREEGRATTNEAAENTVKINELVVIFNSFKEEMGERMKRVEEKVGEFDLRLAVSEDYVQEQIVAIYAAREEDDNLQRPKKRPKRD